MHAKLLQSCSTLCEPMGLQPARLLQARITGVGSHSFSRESSRPMDRTPPHLLEIILEYSLEGLMLKLKLQYFGHLM